MTSRERYTIEPVRSPHRSGEPVFPNGLPKYEGRTFVSGETVFLADGRMKITLIYSAPEDPAAGKRDSGDQEGWPYGP